MKKERLSVLFVLLIVSVKLLAIDIFSNPKTKTYELEPYTYLIELSQSNLDFEINFEKKPDWMQVKYEGDSTILYGIPVADSTGYCRNDTVAFVVTANKYTERQEFVISVHPHYWPPYIIGGLSDKLCVSEEYSGEMSILFIKYFEYFHYRVLEIPDGLVFNLVPQDNGSVKASLSGKLKSDQPLGHCALVVRFTYGSYSFDFYKEFIVVE